MNDVFLKEFPERFGGNGLFFLANIRITFAFPLHIPYDRSWDLQLVRVSQR